MTSNRFSSGKNIRKRLRDEKRSQVSNKRIVFVKFTQTRMTNFNFIQNIIVVIILISLSFFKSQFYQTKFLKFVFLKFVFSK